MGSIELHLQILRSIAQLHGLKTVTSREGMVTKILTVSNVAFAE